MRLTNSPFRAFSLPFWWKSAGLLATGGLLATLVWTLPNWREFWENVSQFPILWQIPANRLVILTLMIKIISPLFIMALIAILLWISALIKPSPEDLTKTRVSQGQNTSVPSFYPSSYAPYLPPKQEALPSYELFSSVESPVFVPQHDDSSIAISPVPSTSEPLIPLPQHDALT